ncbi:MAG: ATP-dependent DNA helicase, partial [Anaerolineales bacterium]
MSLGITCRDMDVDPIEFYLAEGGLLSKRMPDFEFRPQQLDMARAVARSLNEARHLIVEAGTGTGKSLAYLIPAILWAVANNKKVVISTYTKTLQEQILKHDIPLISEKLDLSFRYSLCMGHENYLSLRRLKRASQSEMFARPQENRQLQSIFDWAGQTQTGLKTDLPFEPLPTVWEDVGRQKDLCLGKNCETYEACFYFKERRKWFGAHLLIVNHHLFFANVGAGGGVLPRFDAVVFDEAQNIEEAATSFLGLEISNTGMFYFLDRLYHPKTKRGTLARLEAAFAYTPQVIKLAGQARRAVDKFFEQALETYGRKERVLRFHKPPDLENHLFEPLEELQEALKTLEASLESEEDRLDVAAASNRCFEYRNSLAAFLHQHLEGYVYWLEVTERKRFPRVVLRGVPINLAPVLKE